LGYLAGAIRKNTTWGVMMYNSDFYGQSEQIKVGYLAGPGYKNYLKKLIDPRADVWDEVRQTIASYQPDIVGISSKSQNFGSARMVARIAREVNPEILVVVGGPHPTAQPITVMECGEIDVAVKGEGEQTIVELLLALAAGNGFENISGITYRSNGQILENPPRDLVEDLDQLPFPHAIAEKVLKDCQDYPISAFRYIFATRGCPYNCFFCGSRYIWGRRVRFRSPENVVAEIQSLQKKGLELVHFSDDTFGANRDYLRQICNTLKTHCPNLQWSCETHVNLVDEETVNWMKKAGCHSIEIGIESGNNEMLARIRKNITIEQALAACDTISSRGIEVVALFMVGFPDETEQTLNDTFNAMKKARCDRIHFSIFTPYPGTEAFGICKERGLIGKNYDPSLYGHQSPQNNFCSNISPERFRELVSKMEKMVDRKNVLGRAKRLFTSTGLRRIQELGVRESSRKVLRYFFGK
jgi:radical SAM superfamily enzyme YgiQ (UPF0313 family)